LAVLQQQTNKKIMIKFLREAIDALNLRIESNLRLIHNNERKIKEILKEPVTEQRSEKLNKRFDYNKRLLQENTDSMKLQKELKTYLEKYLSNSETILDINKPVHSSLQENGIKNDFKNLSKDAYFDLTISGAVKFDKQHPYFKDESFLNDLLKHFTETEEYEKCSSLINIKKEHSKINSGK
jgi:hypothetical protein